MTSSLAEVNISLAAHFLDAFSVILRFFKDISNYSDMFDYVTVQKLCYFVSRNPATAKHPI